MLGMDAWLMEVGEWRVGDIIHEAVTVYRFSLMQFELCISKTYVILASS